MNKAQYKKLGYLFFFIFQVVYPIIYMIMLDYPAQLAQAYLIPIILAIISLALSTNLTFKELAQNQINYILGYFLVIIIMYFGWNISQLKGATWFFQFTGLVSFPLVNIVYGLVISNPINNMEFAIGSMCCITRLFYYSWQCSKYIRRQNYMVELKDYQLVLQALMIALYAYYIDQLHKTWQKKNHVRSESLIESKDIQQ